MYPRYSEPQVNMSQEASDIFMGINQIEVKWRIPQFYRPYLGLPHSSRRGLIHSPNQ